MTNLTDIRSNVISAAGAGLTVYSDLDSLPTSGLEAGDQAFVSGNQRFYISNGSGWYNAALVNATPTLSIDPSGAIELNTDGSTTTITLTATDSDYPDNALTFSVESDGNFFGLGTISQDSSVFTITPLSADSATTESAVLTFKASDGISFGTGDKTLTLEFTVANSNHTTLLLKADSDGTDNQVDASANAHTITEAGNVTSTAFTPYHPGGYSIYFDGTGDYITGPSVTTGTTWTVETWVFPQRHYSGSGHFDRIWAIGGTTGDSLVLNIQNTGSVVYRVNDTIKITSSSNITLDAWTHVALVCDGSSTTLYFDGSSVGTVAETSSKTSKTFKISTLDNAQGYMKGYIRDLRLVIGTAVYTSAFTAPTEALTAITNTELLTCHLPYIKDGSTNDHTLTIGGNTSTKRFAPYDYEKYTIADYGGSVYFDGNGDYLSFPDNDGFELDGDFTIELWFYKTAAITVGANTTYGAIIGGNASSGNGWNIYITNSNNVVSFYHSTFLLTSSAGVSDNMWNHVAVTRSGTSLKLFINGTEAASATNSTTFNQNTNNSGSRIGYDINGNGYFPGYIANVRVVNGSAVYTAAFTPPTAPLTAITNTELLTCTNKNDIWDTALGTRIIKNGNVTASATQTKFATSDAVYFDGTGDWIHLPASDQLEPRGNDFTFEWWWYPTTLSQRQWFFHAATDYWLGVDFQTTSGRGLGMWASSNGTSWNLINADNNGNGISSTNPTLNAWNHIAYTRNDSTFTLWLNGTSIASVGSITSSIVDRSTESKVIGSWAQSNHQYPIVGYIQDFRFTKDLARYTSSFTPHTAEHNG